MVALYPEELMVLHPIQLNNSGLEVMTQSGFPHCRSFFAELLPIPQCNQLVPLLLQDLASSLQLFDI